jgi:hypothetical protein
LRRAPAHHIYADIVEQPLRRSSADHPQLDRVLQRRAWPFRAAAYSHKRRPVLLVERRWFDDRPLDRC